MQSNLLIQNLNRVKETKRSTKEYNKLIIKHKNLTHKLSLIPKSSKYTNSLKRDEVNEIYEFTHQFDGSSGIRALTFRENIKNYVRFVKDNLEIDNYLESRIITRIVKGLTGDAKFKYSQRQGDRFNSLNEFYKWFDKEFRLSNLRSDLYDKLKNWQINANTSKLNIVQEYKRELNLFNLTETFAAQSTLDLTQLSIPESINAIIKALEQCHPRIHAFIDSRFKSRLKMPNSFSQLEDWIKDACIYIETSERNSNNKQSDPNKMNAVNNVSTNKYPNYYDNNRTHNQHCKYLNRSNNLNSNIRNHKRRFNDNNKYRGEKHKRHQNQSYNNYGDNDIHRNNNNNGNNNREHEYNNNNDNYDNYNNDSYNHNDGCYENDSYNDNYDNYNNDSYNHNDGYDENDSYNENYDDYNNDSYNDNSGYYGNDSYNDDYHNQEYENEYNQFEYQNYDERTNYEFDKSRNGNNGFERNSKFRKRTNAEPKYKQFDCNKCGIWGHAYVDCKWIHEQFPNLLIEFAKMKKFHKKKNLNTDENATSNTSNGNGDNNKESDHNN